MSWAEPPVPTPAPTNGAEGARDGTEWLAPDPETPAVPVGAGASVGFRCCAASAGEGLGDASPGGDATVPGTGCGRGCPGVFGGLVVPDGVALPDGAGEGLFGGQRPTNPRRPPPGSQGAAAAGSAGESANRQTARGMAAMTPRTFRRLVTSLTVLPVREDARPAGTETVTRASSGGAAASRDDRPHGQCSRASTVGLPAVPPRSGCRTPRRFRNCRP